MIEFHVRVPGERCNEIERRIGPEFNIIARYTSRQSKSKIFIIESTEEEYVATKLAYGDMVWKR